MKSRAAVHDQAPRLRRAGLVIMLVLLTAAAAGFTVAVVQVQAAVAAYLAAESAWSRAQTESVRMLEHYIASGNPEHLEQMHRWLAIPLGDLEARRAMEAKPPDHDAAFEGFLQGAVHPRDVPRLILLFQYFSDAPYFRDAVTAWRASDSDIRRLEDLAQQAQAEWSASSPSPQRLALLREQTAATAERLQQLAARFRAVMGSTARLIATGLSLGSVLFFIVCGSCATLLILRLTRAIRHSEHRFRATFEQAGMGIAQLDEHGSLLDVNEAMCKILRYPRDALLDLRFPELVHPEDRRDNYPRHHAMVQGELDSDTAEIRLLCGDGSTVWGRMTISRFDAPVNFRARYIAIIEDVSEHRRLTEELTHQASHDELTGLLNRRALELALADALQISRQTGATHALCFIDLDQFKIVNDTSGHFVGDYLLRQVSDALNQHLRKGDILARIGGDEFALILTQCDTQTAVKVAEKLRRTLADTVFSWEGRSFNIGCSIGVVMISAGSSDTPSLLRAADAACHIAKEHGRNRIYLVTENDRELVERREQMEWVGRIRTALDENRLFVDAQKLLPLGDTQHLRYEVLVRMQDGNGAVLPPGAFLPAAERFGIAPLIDRWVIEHVCQQLARHRNHLAELEACHINISGRSFDHEDLPDFIIGRLDQYRLPPEKFCFEITETAAVRNLDDARTFMERLNRHGCSFALDDFGAGLSSFGYLKQLPIDFLKIDGSFVRNIARDEMDRAMVRAITDIGQTLGKTIVAEFVEDDETLQLLRDMGVHFAQGFGVHSPAHFSELLSSAGARPAPPDGDE